MLPGNNDMGESFVIAIRSEYFNVDRLKSSKNRPSIRTSLSQISSQVVLLLPLNQSNSFPANYIHSQIST